MLSQRTALWLSITVSMIVLASCGQPSPTPTISEPTVITTGAQAPEIVTGSENTPIETLSGSVSESESQTAAEVIVPEPVAPVEPKPPVVVKQPTPVPTKPVEKPRPTQTPPTQTPAPTSSRDTTPSVRPEPTPVKPTENAPVEKPVEKPQEPTPIVAPKPEPQPTAPVVVAPVKATYREGTAYGTPGGSVAVEFIIATEDDIITSVGITELADASLSASYEQQFLNGARTQIVGKKLSSLPAFDRVGGSSLTPKAFNEVVDRIQSRSN